MTQQGHRQRRADTTVSGAEKARSSLRYQATVCAHVDVAAWLTWSITSFLIEAIIASSGIDQTGNQWPRPRATRAESSR